jgi:hypothetical protein
MPATPADGTGSALVREQTLSFVLDGGALEARGAAMNIRPELDILLPEIY